MKIFIFVCFLTSLISYLVHAVDTKDNSKIPQNKAPFEAFMKDVKIPNRLHKMSSLCYNCHISMNEKNFKNYYESNNLGDLEKDKNIDEINNLLFPKYDAIKRKHGDNENEILRKLAKEG